MNIKSFFKLYTMPILALVFGFGLYYLIFAGTNKHDGFAVSEPFATQAELAGITQTHASKDTPQTQSTSDDTPNTNESSVSSTITTSIDTTPNTAQTLEPLEPAQPSHQALEKSAQPSPTQPSSIDQPNQIYIVIPKKINIRSAPSTASDIIGTLLQHQKISVESIQSDWAKIKNGWVLLSLLQPVSLQSALDNDTTAVHTQTPNRAQAYRVRAQSVNIRAKPDTSSKVIGKLNIGTHIEVLYVKNGWAKIKNGWVLESLLQKQSSQ
ncbi:hypothetical protein BKH46_07160 [Helicobacter sp. 12S02634-8]|uniref:SH3 domain-containing protein n=1 Tax=Helicobacter sp. 12S02634-8 TaxID=1476199 RepID=UPI000BA771EA|nr:SH3 domain-containing protein [Helicobacter sp. 12S02634-8]PAF46514.1 hypothetical protein BKH46_07160 [Helicobacter sp. 12S02634-8]